MKVKVGDNVKILTGKDKGKEGIVTKTLKKKDRVVVGGINIVKKHMKPNAISDVGSIVEVEAPIHVSNVKVVEAPKKAKEVKTTEKKTTKKTTKKEVGDKNE